MNALSISILIFCIIIYVMIFLRICRGTIILEKKKFYFVMLFVATVFAFVDIFWVFFDERQGEVMRKCNYIFNYMYFLSLGLISLVWFYYAEYTFNSRIYNKRRLRVAWSIPMIAFFVLLTCSLKTDWIFYIDENNVYTRGKLYFIQVLVTSGYPIISTIRALIYAYRRSNLQNKTEFLVLAKFIIFPLVGEILQIAFVKIPAVSMGITIGVLWIYINNTESMISLDSLTKLNNRNQLYWHLNNLLPHDTNEYDLYLLIIDADHFKKINDNYGHIEGDRALIDIAQALRIGVRDRKCFISRFAGDEFILVFKCYENDSVDELCRSIKQAVNQINNSRKKKYDISLSIGYALYTDKIKSIADFIDEADDMLYEIKKEKKIRR